MKRLVFMSPGLTEIGGAARRSRALASGLAQRGWRVTVITRAATFRMPAVTWNQNPRVIEVPGFGLHRLGAALYLVVATVGGIIWSRQGTVIAIQLGAQAFAASLVGWITRRPFLAFTTISGRLSDVTELRSRRGFRLRRRLLSRAAFLVGQTKEAAKELREIDPRTRVRVIPTPAPTYPEAPLTSRYNVAFAGRLAEEKGLFTLLQAWKLLATLEPAASLKVIGSGGAYRSVEEKVRRTVAADDLLRSTVSFTGWVDEVDQALRDADVFAYPSEAEGMSNSLLAACALGRVCVVSDIPENRAVLGDDYPLLFPTRDSRRLAETLRQALTDDALREAARSQIRQRLHLFSIERVLDDIEALIDDAGRDQRHCG